MFPPSQLLVTTSSALEVPLLLTTFIAALAWLVYSTHSTKSATATSLSKPTPPLRPIQRPAGTLPVLGNTLQAIQHFHRFHDWISDQSLVFQGEPWRLQFLGQPEITILSTPEAVEEITTTQFHKFTKGDIQREIIEGMLGQGIVAADGTHWFHQRKLAARFFNARVLRAIMMQSMQKNVFRLIQLIDATNDTSSTLAATDTTAESGSLDFKPLFHDFALDTFTEMALGVDLQTMGSTSYHPFQQGLADAGSATPLRLTRPRWLWKLEQWLNIGYERKLKHGMENVYEWLDGVIAESGKRVVAKAKAKATSQEKDQHQSGDDRAATEEADDTDTHVRSFLELFFEYREAHPKAPDACGDNEGHDHEDDDAALSPAMFRDLLLNFVTGAHDTTGAAFSWLFYSLCKYPEIQQKLHRELVAALKATDYVSSGSGNDSAYVTTSHLRHAVYLDACVHEVLRLHPGNPFTFREVKETTVICGDIPLRKGTLVGLPVYAMARQPQSWGDDAATFKPGRWIDETTGELRPAPPTGKFFTFSAGPRACMGRNLAMMELRVVTANLLLRFGFALAAPNDGAYKIAPTASMKHPLRMRATRRAKGSAVA